MNYPVPPPLPPSETNIPQPPPPLPPSQIESAQPPPLPPTEAVPTAAVPYYAYPPPTLPTIPTVPDFSVPPPVPGYGYGTATPQYYGYEHYYQTHTYAGYSGSTYKTDTSSAHYSYDSRYYATTGYEHKEYDKLTIRPPPPRGTYGTEMHHASYQNKQTKHTRSDAEPSATSSNSRRTESFSKHHSYRSSTYFEKNYNTLDRAPQNADAQQYKTAGRHPKKPATERERLLQTWRSNYCDTAEDISRRLAELAELDNESAEVWVRSSPADPFYRRTNNVHEVIATARSEALCKLFEQELVQRSQGIRDTQPPYKPAAQKPRRRLCKHKSEACSSSSDDCSDDEFKIEQDSCMEELTRKLQHPYRIHKDLWHNDPGEMNDGPLCRCSVKSRRIGIRHGIYPGETGYPKCLPNSNNASKLHHYRITISPPTNFLTKTPTIIKHDEHEFLFEGFSLLTHAPLGDLPTCKVIRFNIEYTILYVPENMPENFTIRELELFSKYLFNELLELVDFSLLPQSMSADETCPAFHFLPRFVRDLPDNGKEVLAMCEVLKYLLDSAAPLVDEERLHRLDEIDQRDWQDYVDFIKGMLVTKPGYKPSSVRVDQLDRNVSDLPECVDEETHLKHPAIVHFGIRPPQLSYAGNPEYQKAWREYVKFRHLMANMSKPSFKDKRKLEEKESRLQDMRTQGRMKRNITIAVNSKDYFRTGIMCDIVQHAMLIPVLAGHLRFHKSLELLEEKIAYKFKNRYLLQLALTHPSYKENYGTNPDHARNSLTNCGIRQPEYGDRKIHYMNTRKRGINTLINIMSRFGKEYETLSNITHNERLEFLGDAVVEFLSSIHLFFMFPELEEGGLATYRAAIVQNQHLALLAKKLHLEEFMLYAHGSDLCHELELRHAMANCFEALMGALLLDGGVNVADEVFMNALFLEDDSLREIWKNYPQHPLQEQEPMGDRACISSYPILQELTKFEESIGITFKHIRLLARAFTDRSIGFTHLTLGSNQRLEFLGDTVLQLICSEYLYRHFPEHHEGHLSLLRSSLVNNRTQAVVCDDLGMTKYAVYSNPKADLKTKDRADLLEAFLGALYVDKGLLYCEQFCHVCLFPRLQIFIMNQDWNDPKSKLQQCCLTLRTMDGGEPDIPIYKVIESIGPTNTRVYTVAVYFRSKRLATSYGSSIQQAEMNAAKQALENSRDLFPQLDHQKRVIAKSIKKQSGGEVNPEYQHILKEQQKPKPMPAMEDESHLPKQYRNRIDISSDDLSDDDDDGDDEVDSISGKANEKRAVKNRRSSSDSNSSISSTENEDNDDDVEQSQVLKRKSSLTDNSTPPKKASPTTLEASMRTALVSPHLVEDVSSDDSCFDLKPIPEKQAEKEEDKHVDIPKNVDETFASNSQNELLLDLKDLVEDVSSSSEFESGELSN